MLRTIDEIINSKIEQKDEVDLKKKKSKDVKIVNIIVTKKPKRKKK